MQLELSAIYQRHRQGLFTLAASITRCPSRGEDAVHDAFARLCRASGGDDARGCGDAVAYVFAAVRNAAVDQVRRAPPVVDDIDMAAVLFDLSDDPARQAIDAERRRLVADAVGALPGQQREVVLLRVYAGLAFAQIAQVVDAPLPTVAARYRRALERLRQRLESMV
jgi:RNA polymerase sigma-70 factor (ECF subfamily)